MSESGILDWPLAVVSSGLTVLLIEALNRSQESGNKESSGDGIGDQGVSKGAQAVKSKGWMYKKVFAAFCYGRKQSA